MKISRKSWHYRLLDFYNFEHPNNLCPYFWKVVATLIFTPLILLGFAIVGIFDAYDRRHEPKLKEPSKIGYRQWNQIIFMGILIALGIWSLMLGGYWLTAFLGVFIYGGYLVFHYAYLKNHPHRWVPKEKKKKKPKEPNLLTEYLKAKKHKYCPLIEFTGMDEREEKEWEKWK